MRVLRILAVVNLFIFLFANSFLFADEKITFLFFNDFHSQNYPFREDAEVEMSPMVGGAATLSAYINKYREEHAPNVCVVDAGDDFQGSPVCAMTHGQSQIEILNVLKPDVMVPGNHDFDYGRDGIERLVSQTTFPIVCANAIDKQNQGHVGGQPFIIKEIGGLKIGIIGIITPNMERLTLKENIEGYVFLDAEAALLEYLDVVAVQVDLVVLLSHMGDRADISLARKFDKIDVIFGAHTHKTLLRPKIVNEVIICQAGSRGQYLGILEIWFNKAEQKISRYKMRLEPVFVDDIEPDPIMTQLVDSLEAPVKQKLAQVIGHLELPWLRSVRREESNIANWIADAICEAAQTDVAFMNTSGIRKDLPAGDITLRDVWEIEPFSNSITTFQVTGSELKQILETNHSESGSFLVPSGLRYVWLRDAKRGERVFSMEVGGISVDPDSMYTVSTNNFLTEKAKFEQVFGLKHETKTINPIKILVRDAMVEKIKQEKAIHSVNDNRIIQKSKKEVGRLN